MEGIGRGGELKMAKEHENAMKPRNQVNTSTYALKQKTLRGDFLSKEAHTLGLERRLSS